MQKSTDFDPTLTQATARYTRYFLMIWVWIGFYFFRRKQQNSFRAFLGHLDAISVAI